MDLHLWLCRKIGRMEFWCTETRLCVVYVLCFSLQVRDYSGTYTVKLIPCTTAQNMEFTVPPICSPREPIAFDLDIRFQQVREHTFKLKYPELVLLFEVFNSFSWSFMMNSFVGERPGCCWVQSEHSDVPAVQENLVALWRVNGVRSREWRGLFWGSVTFFTNVSKTQPDVLHTQVKSGFLLNPGDTVYGRVMVDPVQNLGDSFFCSIEKVFLCTGTDGYVPKYNPTKFEFGCLADSPSLLYRFKILVSSFALFSFVLGLCWCLQIQSTEKKIMTFSFSPLDVMFIRRTRLSRRPRPVLLEMLILMLCWR